MSNFKLLGIRALNGCHRNFLKNLQIGRIYPLYPSTKFYATQVAEVGLNDDVAFIDGRNKVPKDLYRISGANGKSIEVNISAIAGKNGTGKSSLVELFFAVVYVFSVSQDLLEPNLTSLQYANKELEFNMDDAKKQRSIREAEKNIFIKQFRTIRNARTPHAEFGILEKFIKEQSTAEEISEKRMMDIHFETTANRKAEAEIRQMQERVKAEIFYQLDDVFYQLIIDGEQPFFQIFEIPQWNEHGNNNGIAKSSLKYSPKEIAKHFFYTIAVNYSHYSLNSKHLGDWVRWLFHKNDGYRTPLVINPMRTNGNFDINAEIGFAKNRLISNLLVENDSSNDDHKVYITEHQYVTEVIFSLNRSKINRFTKYLRVENGNISGDPRAAALMADFMAMALTDSENLDFLFVDFALKEILMNYIVHKIDSIAENYTEFRPGFEFNENTPHLDNNKFFKKLINDHTHITYKLKQAVNFMKYCLTQKDNDRFYVTKDDLKKNKNIEETFTLTQLMLWMKNPKPTELITKLPASIFEVEIKLSSGNGGPSSFSNLSSGEQQLIHTQQSVIYHINNIQSAHSDSERVKYRSLNIIFDEIELYFHPDFQRRFISRFLDTLKKFNFSLTSYIESINILFLTHSPFILSDIPSENVLRLEVTGRYRKSTPGISESQSFAANFHRLLSDSFFFNNGTLMGEFAENKINEVIDKVNEGEQLSDDDLLLINMIGDSFLKSSFYQLIEQKRK